MNFKSLPGAALAWFRETRCKWLLVMTLLGLALRENYPFSNFPMYSSFASRTYYIYLADANGAAVRTREFGLSSSTIKKIFDRYRRKEFERLPNDVSGRKQFATEAAGGSLLHFLDGLAVSHPRAKKLLPGLRVERVEVQQEGSALRLETTTVGQHR